MTSTTSATVTVATATKVTDLLLQAPRLTAENFGVKLIDPEDVVAIEAFEDAWQSFLRQRPGALPAGRKLRHCLELQDQLDATSIQQAQVEMELQRQLDFFLKSKDQLEANFTSAMESTALIQQDMQEMINKEIDDVAEADQSLGLELPWEHYFDNLDELVEAAHLSAIQEDIGQGRGAAAAFANHVVGGSSGNDNEDDPTPPPALPSHRALYLAELEDQSELARAALAGESCAMLLKAYKIDHALLRAETRLKQRQVQRLEKTIHSQKTMAKFLTEHNIWGLLKHKTNGSGSGSVSTVPVSHRQDASTKRTMR